MTYLRKILSRINNYAKLSKFTFVLQQYPTAGNTVNGWTKLWDAPIALLTALRLNMVLVSDDLGFVLIQEIYGDTLHKGKSPLVPPILIWPRQFSVPGKFMMCSKSISLCHYLGFSKYLSHTSISERRVSLGQFSTPTTFNNLSY